MRTATPSLAATAVALASALAGYFLFPFVDQPQHALWDHATIASQAAKVLDGGVPHRDFADTYAGAAAYLTALCYAVLGVKLSSSLVLAAVAAFFVALSVEALLRPFLGPAQSLPASFAAGLLPVFSYVPYPSWFALPAGLFAMAILLREGARSAFVAGVLVGLAGSFKQTHGLFHLACGIAWILWRGSAEGSEGKRARLLPALIAVASMVAIVWTFRKFLDLRVFVVFLVWPSILLAAVLWRGLGRGTARGGMREAAAFIGGSAVVPAMLVAALAAQGAMAEFLRDNFERVEVAEMALYAAYPTPTRFTVVCLSAAAVGLALMAIRPRGFAPWAATALVAAFAAASVLAYSPRKPFLQQVWTTAFYLPPLLLAYVLATSIKDPRRLVLFGSLLALHLVVYPVSKASYLLYPLAPAFAAAAVLLWDATGGRRPALQWVAFLAVAVLALAGQFEPKERIESERVDIPLSAWERSWVQEPIRRLEAERADGNGLVTLNLFHWLFAFSLRGDPTWIDLQVPLYLGRKITTAHREKLREEIRARGVQRVLVPNDQRAAWEVTLGGNFVPDGEAGRFAFYRPK